MALKTARDLVRFAETAAVGGFGHEELSGLMCWDAALRCAQKAGCITEFRAKMLAQMDWADDFSDFVAATDTRVQTPDDMREVPAGAFLAFIRVDPPDRFNRFFHINKGRRHIVHAMVSLGDGWAAGNKNSCIGIGNHIGWEKLDLASGLNWIARRYDAINGYPLGVAKTLPLRIRYRELAKFQDDSTKFPSRLKTLALKNLDTDKTTIVNAGETWSVGPLADCVSLAALKPANSLAGNNVQSIFLWHVNGGHVDPDKAPYKALETFLGGQNADWIFVHGENRSGHGHKSFSSQSIDEELVDGLNGLAGHGVHHYGGGRLVIDSAGQILNQHELELLRP